MFVFKYFKDHLLDLTQKELSTEIKKKILKDALYRIVELHNHDIIYMGLIYRTR
jgi:hypothetical protein